MVIQQNGKKVQVFVLVGSLPKDFKGQAYELVATKKSKGGAYAIFKAKPEDGIYSTTHLPIKAKAKVKPEPILALD